MMRDPMWWRCLAFSSFACLLAACAGRERTPDPVSMVPLKYEVALRRTAMGVPHIKAGNHAGVGYGLGYAQAEDALCTIADSMLTYRGQRSRWFGAQTPTASRSTSGRPSNIDSDFYHRHVLHQAALDTFIQAQPDDVRQLMVGFADGYNRYLRELRASADTRAHAACRDAQWLAPITPEDLFRRAYAVNFAAGYANFLSQIANAQPPATPPSAAVTRASDPLAGLAFQVGGAEGVGSNMFGLGEDATDGGPMLFGNPHWYWRGPDRFYQAQLTIPGVLDVSGATFLGIPVILIGFNKDLAWSHTVSTARRFGFFQLQLAEGEPTRYLRDGTVVPMTAATIRVETRDDHGGVSTVERTLYRTEHGPLLDLSGLDPALAWTGHTAFAIRDINADNHRLFRTWMRWARASTLEAFADIQREDASIPWVNTAAVARGSRQAWYADIGAMPNVTTGQIASCTTSLAEKVTAALPRVPFFDGSRAACDWVDDPDSRQPGAIGPARMPSLLRSDYVANMNDSHWLTHPAAPLTGFPPIIGPAGTQAQSMRTRMGYRLIEERLTGRDGHAGQRFTVDLMKHLALDSRVYSAEVFKSEVLALACGTPAIEVSGDSLTGDTFDPPRRVDVRAACTTLEHWDNTGNTEARGAHVWDEFWSRAARIPPAQLYSVPFNSADPLHTPRGIDTAAAAAVQQALGAAVLRVQESGHAVDAARGDYLYTQRNGVRIGLYGGCTGPGYFTHSCSENRIEQGGYSMDGDPNGNSYIQVVSFAGSTVEAHTLLSFSLSDDPVSPRYDNYTQHYARKQWVRIPFTEAQITAHPEYHLLQLRE